MPTRASSSHNAPGRDTPSQQSSQDKPGPSVKDDATYEALRDKGYSKEKSARIANAKANPSMHPSEKGGRASPYEERTKDELMDRAREIGIEGRSDMTKDELIDALRNH